MVFTKIRWFISERKSRKMDKKNLGKPIHDLLETKNLRDETMSEIFSGEITYVSANHHVFHS